MVSIILSILGSIYKENTETNTEKYRANTETFNSPLESLRLLFKNSSTLITIELLKAINTSMVR